MKKKAIVQNDKQGLPEIRLGCVLSAIKGLCWYDPRPSKSRVASLRMESVRRRKVSVHIVLKTLGQVLE